LIDVHEVKRSEDRQNNLETQDQSVLFYCHEVTLLNNARENQRLQEYGASDAA